MISVEWLSKEITGCSVMGDSSIDIEFQTTSDWEQETSHGLLMAALQYAKQRGL
jgi:hypothetical protein